MAVGKPPVWGLSRSTDTGAKEHTAVDGGKQQDIFKPPKKADLRKSIHTVYIYSI